MQIMLTNRAVAESYLPHETRQVSPVWPMNVNIAIEDLSGDALCDVFHYELVSLISCNAFLANVPATSAHFQLGFAIECVLEQCSANVLCVGKGIHEVEVHLEPWQQETFNLLFPWLVEATIEFNAQSENEPNNPTLRIKLNGNLNDSYDLFVEKVVIDGKNEIWLTCLNKNADPETETKMLMFLARPEQFDEPVDSDEVVFCDEPIYFHVQTSLLTTGDQPIAETSRSVQIPQPPLHESVPTVKSNLSFIDLSCDENEQVAVRNFLNTLR